MKERKSNPRRGGAKSGGRSQALLVGVGLDGKDEHVRITKGDNFRLVGGSEDTHERMTETVIRFNEKLEERGKPLEALERQEFIDLMHEASDRA